MTRNVFALTVDPGIAFSTTRESSLRVPQIADGAPAPGLIVPSTLADNAMELVTTRLDLAPESIAELTRLLSNAERKRASRFAFDRDCRRFTVARARLRQLLAARLGVRPDSVELAFGAHGKPALARCFADSDLRFNVSRSEDVAVYAFAPGCEIGIDVEAVRVISDADDIAARFFPRRENEAYRALDARDRPQGFFNCWTRKEAFIKALGDGLHHPLDSFDVSLAPGEPAKILRVGSTIGDDCGWRLDSFCPTPGFVSSVVTENRKHRFSSAASSSRTAARPATAP